MDSSNYESIVTHYDRREVQDEIARFSKNRWIALYCELLNTQGRPYLLRYKRVKKGKVPLVINNPEDISALLKRFGKLRSRTFYASANVYKEISRPKHLRSMDNIAFCLPTWDIDNTIDKWKTTIAVAKEILAFLSREGVSKSVFLMWSGNGLHIHMHHKAFSDELLRKINALDAAYAIVEYANKKLRSQYLELAKKYQAEKLNVENEMDLQRVFTCPMSLHRSLNVVAICFSPDMINNFSPDWTSIESYRHWNGWDRFGAGEADQLAEKALQTVGTYQLRKISKHAERERKITAKPITKWLRKEK